MLALNSRAGARGSWWATHAMIHSFNCGIAVVVARQRAGGGGQRPRVHDGEQHAECQESATSGREAESSDR